eukprot:5521006-Prymnesium_polylepis.1
MTSRSPPMRSRSWRTTTTNSTDLVGHSSTPVAGACAEGWQRQSEQARAEAAALVQVRQHFGRCVRVSPVDGAA